MTIGEKLLNLRKQKNLSQEEVANCLNVSRQTISKWETDQSTPDLDKIGPLCELFEISADELIIGKSTTKSESVNEQENKNQFVDNRRKRAQGIGQGILLYFVAIAWIMISIPVMMMNPIVASAIFLILCGVATYLIIYSCIIYKNKREEIPKENKLLKQIENIIGVIFLIIYLLISFMTMAWHITWIIWIVCGLVEEILKLIFMLKGDQNEK
ncbi:MAG: helix-turn-helix transcriptional regulator [Bacilli bacterium]|nr:helix-turn-helix transcriptional regulator [Bacilli bacterium]